LEQKSYGEALKYHEDALKVLVENGLTKNPLSKVLRSNIKLIKGNIQ
jgi:hypothetical protein